VHKYASKLYFKSPWFEIGKIAKKATKLSCKNSKGFEQLTQPVLYIINIVKYANFSHSHGGISGYVRRWEKNVAGFKKLSLTKSVFWDTNILVVL
jgi:hypothetical protein